MLKAAIEYLLKLFISDHRLIATGYPLILPPGDSSRDTAGGARLMEEITLFIISLKNKQNEIECF